MDGAEVIDLTITVMDTTDLTTMVTIAHTIMDGMVTIEDGGNPFERWTTFYLA